MKQVNKSRIKVTIILLSLVQLATTGLAPMLAQVSEEFPEVSAASVQFLMTIPGIFVVIFALLSAIICRYINKKTLIAIGACCIAAAGIIAFFIHGNINLLRVWSALLGIGMGLVSTLTNSLAADYFEGNEKTSLMGQITGFGNMGGMIMSIVGGVLAAIAWNMNYLVFLIALPGLICLLLFVPKEEKKATTASGKINIKADTFFFMVAAFIFLFCYNVGPANLSMFITEKAVGGSTITGVAAAVYLLGGALLGLVFGKLDSILKIFTIPVGFLLMAVGFFGILYSQSAVMIIIFCFMSGAAISLVMPQCMNQVSQNPHPASAAFAIALVMASSNMGTFLTPVLSKVAATATHSEAAAGRFLVGGVLGLVLCGVFFVAVCVKNRSKKNDI